MSARDPCCMGVAARGVCTCVAATPKPKRGGLAAIVGKWPGDETDEEIEEGLAALEDPTRHIACGLAFDHGRLMEEAVGLWDVAHRTGGCVGCRCGISWDDPEDGCGERNPYRRQP